MKLRNLSTTHQLVLSAIMAAINVLFVFLSAFLFGFSLFIMLFLPLASVVVALNVDLKYVFVYFFGTLFLSFVINLSGIENTLFLLLPILVSGLAFGFLIKRNIRDLFLLLIVSAFNLLTLAVTIPLIDFIYRINSLNVFAGFIGLQNETFGHLITPSILTLLAFMQTLITLLVINYDARLFGITINSKSWPFTGVLNLGLLLITIPLIIYAKNIALALVFVHLFLTIYTLLTLFKKNTFLAVITLVLALFSALLGFALFERYPVIPAYFGILFAILPVVFIDGLWLYINRLNKRGSNEEFI